MTYISDVNFYNPQIDGIPRRSNNLGKEEFLNLLVTQLRYQNPLEPMQDQEFVAQLAQFAQLEQLERMSSSLDLTTQVDYIMSQTIANTMAASLIGKSVVAEGANFNLTPGEDASLSYNLAMDASSVEIKIFNESGTLVRSIDLSDVTSGNNTYYWDGRNENGSLVGAGEYSYEVTASTVSGESVTVAKRIIGVIKSVKYEDGRAYLMVEGYKVDLSTIIEIEQANEAMINYNN